jgi:hypothetical protein
MPHPQIRSAFPHRINLDGSYDSICTVCHMTVASASDEDGLVLREQSHTCDAARLYQLTEDPLAHR